MLPTNRQMVSPSREKTENPAAASFFSSRMGALVMQIAAYAIDSITIPCVPTTVKITQSLV